MLYGDWNAFEGAFFPEFDPEKHTAPSLPPQNGVTRFRALDYGLDMTCCLWCACDAHGRIYVYRELYKSGLLISEAAKAIIDMTPETEAIRYTVASPDLWNRRQETGKSGFDIMTAAGLTHLIRAENDRIPGWRALREQLKCDADGNAGLVISDCCRNLIRCLPMLRFDEHTREDAADRPHELTHAPEALRYAVMSRIPKPVKSTRAAQKRGSAYAFDERTAEEGYREFLTY